MSIYERAIVALETEGLISNRHSILVTCAGPLDARALAACGLTCALLTNIDKAADPAAMAPYRCQRADAENLPYADDSFDWGFVHAGLHHCRSPHRGLTELLRVARKGVLVVEARDSLVMRLAVRLGLTGEYEIEAVAISQSFDGVRNSAVPNFIYRWTEREVRKAAESAMPDTVNDLRFFYDLRLPEARLAMFGPFKRASGWILGLAAKALFRLTPTQGNHFAFAIIKTGEDKPWIKRTAAGAELTGPLDFDPDRYASPEQRAA